MTNPVQITAQQALAALHAATNGLTIKMASPTASGSMYIQELTLDSAAQYIQDADRLAFHDHLFGFDLAILHGGTFAFLDVPRIYSSEV